jgi:hypothetical protein
MSALKRELESTNKILEKQYNINVCNYQNSENKI